MKACGCGEFTSPAHCLLNSLYSSEGQLFPLSSRLTSHSSSLFFIPPSSFSLSQSLSRSLSLAGFSFHQAVQQQSIAQPPTPLAQVQKILYRQDRNMHCQKPPSNRHHHLTLPAFLYLSTSLFVSLSFTHSSFFPECYFLTKNRCFNDTYCS